MINVSIVRLSKLKNQNLGLGSQSAELKLLRFGFPVNWRISPVKVLEFKERNMVNLSALPRVEKSLKEEILSHPLFYNGALQKKVLRRIDFLKLNRSWRGVRHACFLPTRGQRTKTNARTRKSRRRVI